MILKRKLRNKIVIKPIALTAPNISTDWFKEPTLIFANDMEHIDPKVGIPLYGPRSLGTHRHKNEIHIGFIGTSDAIGNAIKFYQDCARGVDGDNEHAPFPGCNIDQGFRSNLVIDSNLVEKITRQETKNILETRNGHERFNIIVSILERKMEILTQKDYPLDYIVLVLPEDIYKRCKTTDYREKGIGIIHRDLRRTFKALAMKYQKPTQIMLETTTGLISTTRELDHKSNIAWNLFTGLYFKIDGLPWGPFGLPVSSCFVGISFFRPLGEASTLRTSVVQAFDENGEGLVLRGHNFYWDEKEKGKSPHLTNGLAGKLIEMVLDRYFQERKQLPQRVVIHKSSRFENEEREGFEQALKRVTQYDLISVCPTNEIRLIRAGKYPPLRGTVFTIGDASYLYTSGYLTSINGYPHGHVPAPLQITDHIGDTSKTDLLKEILILTKMNWNSANSSGLMPITLRFSRLVGDILREVPIDETPQPKYKYYM